MAGVSLAELGNLIDPVFLERGGDFVVAVRDARGTSTDISPVDETLAVKFSPIDTDGLWRDDLFAWVKNDDGTYAKNAATNLGFHWLGAAHVGDGPNFQPRVQADKYFVEQSNFVFDNQITQQEEPFSVTPVETAAPWVHRLRSNNKLNNDDGSSACPAPGGAGYTDSQGLSTTQVPRQFLMMRERTAANGLTLMVAFGYSFCTLSDIGNSRWGKQNADSPELTFEPQLDSTFMGNVNGKYARIIRNRWIGGPAWDALKSAPVGP